MIYALLRGDYSITEEAHYYRYLTRAAMMRASYDADRLTGRRAHGIFEGDIAQRSATGLLLKRRQFFAHLPASTHCRAYRRGAFCC